MPLSAQEKLERKQRLEEKREARRLAKEKKEKEKAEATKENGGSTKKPSETTVNKEECYIFTLSDDTLHRILWFLPSREMGALTLCCRHFSQVLVEARVSFLMDRLHCPNKQNSGAVGFADLCSNQTEARCIIKQAYGGGDTGRIVAKGKNAKSFVSEFVSYARFLEEAVSGYGTLNYGGRKPSLLPPFVNGKFVSVSPEHSLSRIGGGGRSGAGGSGVASWGVGKRGQLGHGKRQDEELPRRFVGGIGYGIRIVQVSAGGGLVRVAHSLLLTSSGRVLSCGTGQYGALGHGYSDGKQLPDVLRPKYIDALAGIRCVCVAAGELHSAAVTVDGDVYTWGDGFCGQLGHADKSPQVAPVQVTSGGLEDECVAHIACGARHTVAVTDDGDVFSWGLGHFGVLGRSFTPYDHDPDAALAGFGGADDGELAEAIDQAMVQEQAPEPAEVAENTANGENGNFVSNPWNFDNLMARLDMVANLALADSSNQCIPMVVDSLQGVKIVGVSAGHRHTLLLDERGWLYSCGAGITGCLGHGDHGNHKVPMKIRSFDDDSVQIMQMSAGVDMSMAVSTTGDVYAWGKTDGGRIGLGLQNNRVTLPRRVRIVSDGEPIKAVDVECGYVHSIVVGLNGTIHQCGRVGIDDEEDGQNITGDPKQVDDFNIWHRIAEAKDLVKTAQRWKKYDKYEVRGRQKMMTETVDSALK